MTRVWSLLRPLLPAEARFSTGILVVCSLLAGILEAALLIVVVSAALAVAGDQGGTHLDLAIFRVDVDVEVALIIAACAGAMSLLLHLMTARITADLSAGVLCTARTRAVNGFASASWARQANEREGSLQETVSTLSMQSSALVVVLANLLAALLSLGALFLAAMVLDPIVTVVVIAFGAVLFLVVKPLGSLTQRRAENFVRENSRFAERISQWGSLAMELRVFGVEQSEASRLREHNEATTQALGHMRFISRAGALLYRDLAVLFLIGAIVALHIVSSVDLASFGAVILLIVRALTYAQAAQSNMQQLREQEPSLVALVTRLESLESARDAFGNMAVSAVAPIDLRGVTYDYGHGRNGVTDIDLQIARGEAVGIVGPSGGGKTTLAQILLRLRTPTRGRILVAGTPYGEIAEESWSRLVALVPQEPKLAEGTVADNIRFFRDHISDLDVEGAAAKAHVLDDIRLLPLGFETELGPRGTGLSGGQKQRVAIARALAGHPLLLVLDEPTSALDNRSEELLRDTITELKGDVTLVIIAHRLSTLEVCDRIIGIESGRLRTFRSLREAAEQVQG